MAARADTRRFRPCASGVLGSCESEDIRGLPCGAENEGEAAWE